MTDIRIQELEELATAEGIKLPMSPEQIIALEDDGHVVDLKNGGIIIDGANDWFELSTSGEAVSLVWDEL